ncbi:hypothetical protein, partial [Kozakia baliensis]|uniref:hypothetical protein n=1 Tax=Kozakia baliensis TaxID=153496 RepID=UPI001F32FA7A
PSGERRSRPLPLTRQSKNHSPHNFFFKSLLCNEASQFLCWDSSQMAHLLYQQAAFTKCTSQDSKNKIQDLSTDYVRRLHSTTGLESRRYYASA